MRPPIPAAIHGRTSPRDGGRGGVWRGGSLLAAGSAGAASGRAWGGGSAPPERLMDSGDGSGPAAVSGVGFVIGSLATSLAVPSIVAGGRRRRLPGGRPLPESSRSALLDRKSNR